jgi:hypothetical protein
MQCKSRSEIQEDKLYAIQEKIEEAEKELARLRKQEKSAEDLLRFLELEDAYLDERELEEQQRSQA